VQSSSQQVPPAGVVDLWSRRVGPERPDPATERALDPEERRRAGRFRSDRARALFVQGRSLLREALATYLGYPPRLLRLDQRCVRCGAADHGKPRLLSPASDLTFNLSHADGLVIVAVCSGQPVGVDVEQRERAQAMPQLVGALLSPIERAALEEIPQADRAGVLLRCWVRKEALLKATGEGLSLDSGHVGTVAVRAPMQRLRWPTGT
jgi:4'-phosphopantetheinyl transferase